LAEARRSDLQGVIGDFGAVTKLFITIDTEYSFGLAAREQGGGRADNFARSISCETPSGAVGIHYQMDHFDAHGLKAVFFVDPMPGLVWGTEAIADVIGPIVARGHEVQLHLHSEWLALAGANNPLGERTGRNIKDFNFAEQCILIDRARELLIAAGAPRPVAFRAGNYGADDNTLRALAELGLAYDTSHCPAIVGSDCAISLGAEDRAVREYCGITEVPIGAIAARGGALRHFQLTALSGAEITAALRFAVHGGQDSLTLVSHSFELLSRDRTRANVLLKRRFERLCAQLAQIRGLHTAAYAGDPPRLTSGPQPVLPHYWARTAGRLAEQALGNALYGAK
jgi:hypothetical protein